MKRNIAKLLFVLMLTISLLSPGLPVVLAAPPPPDTPLHEVCDPQTTSVWPSTQIVVSSTGYLATWHQTAGGGNYPYSYYYDFGDGSYGWLAGYYTTNFTWQHPFNGAFRTYYQTFGVKSPTCVNGNTAYTYASATKQ